MSVCTPARLIAVLKWQLQAKKKLLSRVEAQIRTAEELPPLDFVAPRTINADKTMETATQEIQTLMEGIKREINDKLANANAVSTC